MPVQDFLDWLERPQHPLLDPEHAIRR